MERVTGIEPALAGAYTGARLQSHLPDALIRRLAGILVIAIAARYGLLYVPDPAQAAIFREQARDRGAMRGSLADQTEHHHSASDNPGLSCRGITTPSPRRQGLANQARPCPLDNPNATLQPAATGLNLRCSDVTPR